MRLGLVLIQTTLRARARAILPTALRPGARRIYVRAIANRVAAERAKRRLIESTQDGEERLLLQRVDPLISPDDNMFVPAIGLEQYLQVGLEAVGCIEAVLRETGTNPRAILDLPSGWGRVLRYLAVRWPEAELTACDLLYDGPRFCARRFGARPVASSTDLGQLSFPGRFDLIWVGSLITHLDAANIEALLALLRRSLNQGGTLVLTAHGEARLEDLRSGGADDGLRPADSAAAIDAYQATGLGFVPYAEQPAFGAQERAVLDAGGYGVSYTSKAWLQQAAERAGFRPVLFRELGWSRYQDVHGFQRV